MFEASMATVVRARALPTSGDPPTAGGNRVGGDFRSLERRRDGFRDRPPVLWKSPWKVWSPRGEDVQTTERARLRSSVGKLHAPS